MNWTQPELFLSGADGDYLSRWKRIIYLDGRFRDGTYPNATDLARQCGVTSKTIQRDIDALRTELSAPIEYLKDRKGYHYSDRTFALPSTALSERDLFALMVAENAIDQYAGTPLKSYLRDAFDKMLALLPGGVRDEHQLAARAIHFGGLPPPKIDPAVWSQLAGAIHHKTTVRILYRKPNATGDATPTPRIVHPYNLLVRDRDWFLVAHHPETHRTPIYYLPRITEAEMLDTPFEIDPEYHPEKYFRYGFNALQSSGAPRRIVLRFHPEYSHLVEERAWAPRQKVKRHDDGTVTVSFKSSALFEIERQVLRHTGGVEVVEPAELRAAVLESAKLLLGRHR